MSPANLRFVGPVLVRSEAGYHVLSLPSHGRLVVGDLTDQDCRDFAAAVRAGVRPQGTRGNPQVWDALVKDGASDDLPKLREVLSRAKADPLDAVRVGASKIESAVNEASAE